LQRGLTLIVGLIIGGFMVLKAEQGETRSLIRDNRLARTDYLEAIKWTQALELAENLPSSNLVRRLFGQWREESFDESVEWLLLQPKTV